MAGTELSSKNGQLGPGLIGALVTMMLYGILTDQCYTYYRQFPQDHTSHRVLVAFLWLIDTFHVAVMSHAAYWYFVTNYGNPDPFEFAVWSLILTWMLNILVAFIVQLYFTWRIHQVSGNKWWLTISITTLVLLHCAFGMENVVILFVDHRVGLLRSITLGSAVPWAVFTVLSDMAISGSLCFLLSGKKTGFRDTNSLIDSLMIFAINRSLLTCAVAILEIICFVTLPNSLAFIGVDLISGKLYSNSLLATLNARKSLALKYSGSQFRTTESTNLTFAPISHIVPLETAEMFGVMFPSRAEQQDGEEGDLYRRRTERSTIRDLEEKIEVEGSNGIINSVDQRPTATLTDATLHPELRLREQNS
ncbi:hypothetical protein SISSUDRAFT_882538 [Sistotremastrum suecicum HHB10207 ss-3]|uniref:DUF6534 domain-containing protein n=1 Tax=Sistotremastrum suecicum HHB10207 ss-3 TaxID=1314776 RepID=A0A166C8H6_9AGAM|nr:hypothetical protein SISSUDRAFT_882538 [Sistotremastrum suecicum HHB10207 ss-3]